MAVVPCPACHKPMNDVAIVCPHCNARRGDVKPGIAGKALSPAEIRALIATDAMLAPAPSQGLLSTLILPHPSTTGPARVVELALTVVSLPLVAAGAMSLAIARSRTRRKYQTTRGELAPVLAMMSLGGFGLSGVLSLLGASLPTNIAVTGASMVALIARGVIRARAAPDRSRDLHRLAGPEPEQAHQPPIAQVVQAPRRPSTSPAPKAAPTKAAPAPVAPANDAAPSAGEAPRLLK